MPNPPNPMDPILNVAGTPNVVAGPGYEHQKPDPNGKWKSVPRAQIKTLADAANVLNNWAEWQYAWAKQMHSHGHAGPIPPAGKYPPPEPPFGG